MKEVPQIARMTGVSLVYFNEYLPKTMILFNRGFDALAKSIEEVPIKKYEERFPPDQYVNVVNDKNRDNVRKLDEIAEEVNEKYIDPNNFTEIDFKRTVNDVCVLLWGREDSIVYRNLPEK